MKKESPLALWRCVALLLHYFVGYLYYYPRLGYWITVQFDPHATTFLPVVAWGIYLGMIGITVALAWPLLKQSRLIPTHWKKGLENTVILIASIYFISLLTSSFITLVSGSVDSVNEQIIQEQFKLQPVLLTFTSIIYAPLVEELVFRGALYGILEPKLGFWKSGLISGIAFGMIHVLDSLLAGNFVDVLYLLQYGAIGVLFCYAYKINQSIYSPIFLHFVNNLVATLVTLFLIFGS